MKTIMFKKDSWHFRLINYLDLYNSEDFNDLCSYSKVLFKSIISALCILTFIIILITFFIIYPVVYNIVILQYGYFDPPDTLIISMALWIIVLIVILCFYINYFIEKYLENKRKADYYKKYESTEPIKENLIKHLVKSIKDKVCFKIEFK